MKIEMIQQVFSQAEVQRLVEQARREGEQAGYHRGYQEAYKAYGPPPPPPVICPECGSECRIEHEPFEQEYPGACYTPASDWAHCTNEECDHCHKITEYSAEGQVQENTRGW